MNAKQAYKLAYRDRRLFENDLDAWAENAKTFTEDQIDELSKYYVPCLLSYINRNRIDNAGWYYRQIRDGEMKFDADNCLGALDWQYKPIKIACKHPKIQRHYLGDMCLICFKNVKEN